MVICRTWQFIFVLIFDHILSASRIYVLKSLSAQICSTVDIVRHLFHAESHLLTLFASVGKRSFSRQTIRY